MESLISRERKQEKRRTCQTGRKERRKEKKTSEKRHSM